MQTHARETDILAEKMRGMHFVLAYMNFFLYFCTAFYAELKKLNTDN